MPIKLSMYSILLLILPLSIFGCVTIPFANAQESNQCKYDIVLEGGEQLLKYGMDSTKNWWAITAPFQNFAKLYVNGQATQTVQIIREPIFSHDGEHWATFAEFNGNVLLQTEKGSTIVPGNAMGSIVYSGDSKTLVYSYTQGMQEVINHGNNKYQFVGKRPGLFVSYDGSFVAFVVEIGSMKSIVVNGRQGSSFDEIQPIGFWQEDNQFIYAARSGNQWRIYRGENDIAGPYTNVTDVVMNLAGTVCAAIVSNGSSMSVVLIADEYRENITSRQYLVVEGLALHPTAPIYAARARISEITNILINGQEYGGGIYGVGKPQFTHDGKEVVVFGCDAGDCFISINGRKTSISQLINTAMTFPHKPGSRSFAFSTETSLIYRTIENSVINVSYMCDEVSLPRFNWRTNTYQALGRVSNRLYLLQCNSD